MTSLHRELSDSVAEFLEPYEGMEPADLFAKLPGEEAQRVVRARKVLQQATALSSHLKNSPVSAPELPAQHRQEGQP